MNRSSTRSRRSRSLFLSLLPGEHGDSKRRRRIGVEGEDRKEYCVKALDIFRKRIHMRDDTCEERRVGGSGAGIPKARARASLSPAFVINFSARFRRSERGLAGTNGDYVSNNVVSLRDPLNL